MMENVTILMYLKSRKNAKGESPIYLRVTVDGKRVEKSLNKGIDSKKWDRNKQRGKGSMESIKILNEFLNSVEHNIYRFKQELKNENKRVTVQSLMNKYLGVDKKNHTLIEVFKYENERTKKLIKESGFKKYITTFRHVKSFLKHQYNLDDIDIQDIDYQFVVDFDFYLRSEKSIANTTTVRYVKTLKKIFKTTIDKGWVNKDPFINYKKKVVVEDVVCLTQDEVDKIYSKKFTNEGLVLVRDIFIFSCYTALAYCDVVGLTEDKIFRGMDGYRWLKIKRGKTKVACDIPLFPIAEAIINKYKDNPKVLNSDKLLPVLSNQKMNEYLKAIGDLCGINKRLHFHMARHTFGTTIAAVNRLPIETMKRIMGHKTDTQARHYAKISTAMIVEDVAELRLKLSHGNKSLSDTQNQAI